MSHPPSAASAARPRHPLRVLFSLIRDERGRVIKAVASSVINKFFDVMPEILIGIALDVVVRGEDSFVAQIGITVSAEAVRQIAFGVVIIGMLLLYGREKAQR